MAITINEGLFMGFNFCDDGSVTINYPGKHKIERTLSATPYGITYSNGGGFTSTHIVPKDSWIWTPEGGWFFSKEPKNYPAHKNLNLYHLNIVNGTIYYSKVYGIESRR